MNQVLAAAIGSAADIAVLLVARLAYQRYRRKRHRETVDRITREQLARNNKIEIRVPGGDAEFREWLRKSIRIAGQPPKPEEPTGA